MASAVGGIKRCPKCDQNLDVSCFNNDTKRPDGLKCWCKTCHNAAERKRLASLDREGKDRQNAVIELGVRRILKRLDPTSAHGRKEIQRKIGKIANGGWMPIAIEQMRGRADTTKKTRKPYLQGRAHGRLQILIG